MPTSRRSVTRPNGARAVPKLPVAGSRPGAQGSGARATLAAAPCTLTLMLPGHACVAAPREGALQACVLARVIARTAAAFGFTLAAVASAPQRAPRPTSPTPTRSSRCRATGACSGARALCDAVGDAAACMALGEDDATFERRDRQPVPSELRVRGEGYLVRACTLRTRGCSGLTWYAVEIAGGECRKRLRDGDAAPSAWRAGLAGTRRHASASQTRSSTARDLPRDVGRAAELYASVCATRRIASRSSRSTCGGRQAHPHRGPDGRPDGFSRMRAERAARRSSGVAGASRARVRHPSARWRALALARAEGNAKLPSLSRPRAPWQDALLRLGGAKVLRGHAREGAGSRALTGGASRRGPARARRAGWARALRSSRPRALTSRPSERAPRGHARDRRRRALTRPTRPL